MAATTQNKSRVNVLIYPEDCISVAYSEVSIYD
ncbi:Uncharacterised protein [Klebsiella oxytoca]|nr:Uncharacterised protein [Klebsiella oxytoca]